MAALHPESGHPLQKTRAISEHFVYNPVRTVGSVRRAIKGCSPDLIVPCDDRAVYHIHELYTAAQQSGDRDTVELIERSLGSPASLPIVSSRSALLQVARREGVSVPETAKIRNLGDLQEWSDKWPGPAILKVDGSWGGHGVRMAFTLREGKEHFARMCKPLGILPAIKQAIVNRDRFWLNDWWHGKSREITVQSYIEGRPANCVVWCWKGAIHASIAVEVVEAQQEMGPATVVRMIDNPQMIIAASKIVESLGLSGFYGFDFMLEKTSGRAYLVELNPRCALPCHLRLDDGRDLIDALCKDVSGDHAQTAPLPLKSDIVAYFPQAWHVNPASKMLRSEYHDVPWSEPELVAELIRIPWPDRGWMAQFSDRIRDTRFEQRGSKRCVFLPTLEEDASHGSISDDSEVHPPLTRVVEKLSTF